MDKNYVSPVVLDKKTEDEVRDDFGDDTFDKLVTKFCESTYDIYLNDFHLAFEAKSFKDIKAHVHKFKTTAG